MFGWIKSRLGKKPESSEAFTKRIGGQNRVAFLR